MNATPLVSVVIPSWNRWPLLREAVASVQAQTLDDWELIVVDDGSTDETLAGLRALGLPRLRAIAAGRVGHLGRLRNLGAAAARGRHLAFLDSDDLWRPAKLERQLAAQQASDACWSYTGYALFDGGGADIPLRAGNTQAVSGRIIAPLLSDQLGVATSTMMIERDLYRAVGGFCEHPSLPFRGDLELSLRLARHWDVLGLAEPLTRIREHGGRSTAGLRDGDELSAVAHALFLADERDPGLRRLARRRVGQCLAEAGARQLAAGRVERAAALFGRSVAAGGIEPRTLRALARGLRGLAASVRPA